MTIEEIKKLAPGAEVYSLAPNVKYIITYDMNSVQIKVMKSLGETLADQGIWAAIVGVDGTDAMAVFRVEPS